MSLSETITKWIETKQRLSELEKKHEKYRSIIQSAMEKDNLSELQHTDKADPSKKYVIKKSTLHRETISKNDIPVHLWEQYHKTSSYIVIRVCDKNDKNDKTKRNEKE